MNALDISQWTKAGEYYDSRIQGPIDQIEQISTAIGALADYHGNRASDTDSRALASGVQMEGIIGIGDPGDYFNISAKPGMLTAKVMVTSPAQLGNDWMFDRANLKVEIKLLDSKGSILMTKQGLSMELCDIPKPRYCSMCAGLSYQIPSSGFYYLAVIGVGQGNALAPYPTGFTAYGSKGTYSILATYVT